MQHWFGDIWLVRLFFERGLGALYLIAFLSSLNQFPALLGERGLLPAPDVLKRLRFRDAPTLFHWRYSDSLLRAVAWTGILLSALVVAGIVERAPWWGGIVIWLVMWALYMSIVNVGQTFYAFGWESMLLEAGFFAAFLGPRDLEPPVIAMAILRWMLFRVEFGAGLIKIRHDECWRNLTCLDYHYETQPLPNPVSWYFHRFPKWFQRQSVVFSHFVQLVAPWGLFLPQPVASIAAGLLIVHQFLLIISGNYSWLNWLTVVLGISGLADWGFTAPAVSPRPLAYDVVLYLLLALTVLLSIRPAINLFTRNQSMNYCWNRFHLVCAYGAFGSITKTRYEIVIEGSDDGTEWKEYEFRAKPVDPMRRPPQVAPYHLRLDWLMWFLPFSVMVARNQIYVPGFEMWFVRFIRKLLEGDKQMLSLMRRYPDHPPRILRASYYVYEFTDWKERRESGAFWKRKRIGEYLPAVTLDALRAAMDSRPAVTVD